jgi:glycosyltransferase involved in cell wall biosynthesis
MDLTNLDILHANWTYEFAWAAVSSRHRTVVTAHDRPVLMALQLRSLFRASRTLLAWKAIRGADAICAVSPSVGSAVRKLSPRRPVPVIANALPADAFNDARRIFDSSLPITFMSISNGFDFRKNTKTLINAFAIARKRAEFHLELFGRDHGNGEAAHAWAMEHAKDSDVQFHGSVSHAEIAARLRRPNVVLAHPSRWEACCMAIAEALAAGVPVIGGRESGDVPWQLGAGRAGVLVDVQSPSALAAAMTSLADPSVAERLSTLGRSQAHALHSYPQWMSAYMAVYQRVISGHL